MWIRTSSADGKPVLLNLQDLKCIELKIAHESDCRVIGHDSFEANSNSIILQGNTSEEHATRVFDRINQALATGETYLDLMIET